MEVMLKSPAFLLLIFYLSVPNLTEGQVLNVPEIPKPTKPHHHHHPQHPPLFLQLIPEKPEFSEEVKAASERLNEGFLQIAKQKEDSDTPPKIDLAFAVVSSSLVGPYNFRRQLWFVKKMVREFSVSPSGTRVALVSYATTPKTVFGLKDNVNRECTAEAVAKAKFTGGESAPGKALMFIRDRILTIHNGSRHDARRVLFLILNREPTVGINPWLEAKALRGDGVEIFVLYIDPLEDSQEPLFSIANEPAESHFFTVQDFGDLGSLGYLARAAGFSRDCEGSGVVYDECNRRCTCQNGERVNCYRVRKEFLSMSLKEREHYLQVFLKASTLPQFKDQFDQILTIHPTYFWKIHVLKYFFPWHRWYILKFENLLRKIDCRATVPYWDWSRSKSNGTFYSTKYIRDLWNPGPHGLGGNGVPPSKCVLDGQFRSDVWALSPWLQYSCLRRIFNPEKLKSVPTAEKVRKFLSAPLYQFERFERIVRHKWHNEIHNAVGGTMAEKESSSAPEFWFHHAFLDKLWSDWQKRGAEFKFNYYRSVHTTMPGTNLYGRYYMDLDNQPMCVRAVYDDAE